MVRDACREVFGEGFVDVAFEPRLLQVVKSFLFWCDVDRTKHHVEFLFVPGHQLSLPLRHVVLVQVDPNVDNGIQRLIHAEQVHFVEHQTPSKPARCEVGVVSNRGQTPREVSLHEHAHEDKAATTKSGLFRAVEKFFQTAYTAHQSASFVRHENRFLPSLALAKDLLERIDVFDGNEVLCGVCF